MSALTSEDSAAVAIVVLVVGVGTVVEVLRGVVVFAAVIWVAGGARDVASVLLDDWGCVLTTMPSDWEVLTVVLWPDAGWQLVITRLISRTVRLDRRVCGRNNLD